MDPHVITDSPSPTPWSNEMNIQVAGCSRLPVNPCHFRGSDLKDEELEDGGGFYGNVSFDCMGKGPIAHARPIIFFMEITRVPL